MGPEDTLPISTGTSQQVQVADKSLARPGRKQARKHVGDARDFNNIETRAVIKFSFLQGKAPKEIHAILTETLVCFLPVRAKDLSAPASRRQQNYKACPSESWTEVGAPLFPAVERCDFSGRWQCMSGEIWYTLDNGSVLLTETEAR